MKNIEFLFSIILFLVISGSVYSQSSPTNIALAENAINENESIGTLVGVFSASDPDGDASTFELVAGTGDTDNASFTIQNDNELTSAEIFNHEVKSSYNVRVRVTDATDNTYEEAFLITITNVNEPPTGFSFGKLQIKEGNLSGTKLIDLTANDPDLGDTFRFELVEGSGSDDNDSFDISGDEINGFDLIIQEAPDFESKPSYNIRLAVFDELGETYEEAFTVIVTDNQNTFSEWVSSGTINGGLDRVYSSALGPNNQYFVSASVTGSVSLNENIEVDDEGFIAVYDENLELIDAIKYTEISNEFITIDEVFEIEFEDNGDIYLLANVTSISNNNTHIIKLNSDFDVQWRFDVSERFDGSIESKRGNFSVDNGLIAFARNIRALSGRYYFGLVGSNGSNYTGPDFLNNEDQAYVALIDTAGVAQWIDFTPDFVNSSDYIADIKIQDELIYLIHEKSNIDELLVIDTARSIQIEKSFTKLVDPGNADQRLAVSPSGDIYVTGRLPNSGSNPGSVTVEGNQYFANTFEASYFLKYNSDGVAQFVKLIDVPGGDNDFLENVSLDATDASIFLYGTNRYDTILFEGVKYDLAYERSSFMMKFLPDGSFSDIYDVGGDADMFAKGFGLLASGEILMAGDFRKGSVEIGANTFSNNLYPKISDYDIYLGKLSGDLTATASKSLGNMGGEIIWRDASQTDDGLIYGVGDFVGEVQIGETMLFSEDRDLVIATFNTDQSITDVQHIENNFTDEYAERIEAFTYEELGTGLIKKSFYLVGRGEEDQSLDFNGTNLIPNKGTFLVQLNENYFGLWSTSFGVMSSPKTTLDTDNQIYISGTFANGGLNIEGNEVSNFVSQTNSIFINYDVSGSLDWYKAQVVQRNISVGEPTIIENQVYFPIRVIGANASNLIQDNIDITWPNASLTYYGTILAYDLAGSGLWGKVMNGESLSNYNLPSVYQTPSGNVGFSMFNKYSELDATGSELISNELYGDLDYATISKGLNDQLIVYGYGSQTFGPSILIYEDEYIPSLLSRHSTVSSSDILLTNDLFVTSSRDSIFVFGEYGLNLLKVNSAPESLSLGSVDVEENLPEGAFLTKISVTDTDDSDGFEFEILENNFFYSISNDSLFVNQLVNFEQPNEQHSNLKLRVTDPSGGTLSQSIEMNIVDVNDPPTNLNFNFEFADQRSYGPNGASVTGLQTRELLPLDSAITVFTTQDEDAGETFVYSLVTDSVGFEDHVYFKFNEDTLQVADTLDYEFIESRETVANEGYYSILVKVTDSGGESIYEELRIGLVNQNEPPMALQLTVTFNLGNGNQTVYDSFPENSNSQLYVKPLDPDSVDIFDSDSNYSIGLVAGSGSDDNVKMTLPDSIAGDDGFNPHLRPTSSDPYFGLLNFEEDSVLNLRLGFYNHDSTFYKEFPVSIPLIDVNDQADSVAIVGLDQYRIEENTPVGTRLGLVKAIDEDSKSIFRQNEVSISEDFNNPLFAIDENDSLYVATDIDKEALGSTTVISFSVFDSTEPSQSPTLQATLEVVDINEPPVINYDGATISVDENAENISVSNWNVTATDPESVTLIYELVSGIGDNDNGSFYFSSETNPQLYVGDSLNYEENMQALVRVRVSDPEGLFAEETFTIQVNNVNDAPTGIAIDNAEILENQEANTLVGTLNAIDDDADDSHTFDLVGENQDNTLFTISGNQLFATQTFDFETNSSYVLTIRVNDGGNETVTTSLEILVVDANDPPTGITLSNAEITENLPAGTVVGELIAEDQDESDTFTFSVEESADFQVSGNQLISARSFDFFTEEMLLATITVEDSESESYSLELIITILNDPSDDDEETLSASQVSGVSIYPNPTSGYLRIESDKSIEVSIFGLNGKAFISKILESSDALDISHLPAGQYILNIHQNGELIESKKVLKIK